MIIATFIISCLTLIAVSVGLLLNYKSNRTVRLTIASFEAAVNKNIEDAKNASLLKLQEINNSTNSKLDTYKSEIQNTVKDNSKYVHEEIVAKVKESGINNYNTITSAKTAVLESLEPKVEDLKTETIQFLQKLSIEVNLKIDTALQSQEQRNTDLINEVKEKFGKIIEEIKSPLTLD
jgi:uncharacterized membrane protein